MSLLAVQGGATGTGTVTLLAPITNTNQTLTLPDVTDTVAGIAATQTLTNKTLTSPTISSPTISGTPVINASIITSGTAVPTTSGTSVDFTGIPSYAKRITIILNGVSTNSSNTFLVQVGDGSIVTTGYKTTRGQISTSTAVAQANTTAIAFWAPLSSTSAHFGNIVLTTVGSNIWVSSFAVGQGTEAGASYGGGGITLSGALDRFRLTTTAGDTFDAGSVNILYE